MMLLFQHSNLKAVEWMGIRRELAIALRKVDEANAVAGEPTDLASHVKIQIINTGIFEIALRVVEYFRPGAGQEVIQHTDPRTQTSMPVAARSTTSRDDPTFTHGTSTAAYNAVAKKRHLHELTPLLDGPVAILTFPDVSTGHLKATLSILAPSKDGFPAPKRSTTPGYYEPAVQAGLQKLFLLGARMEGSVFDVDKTKWVGTIQGGRNGLRGQLVAMLQSVGGGALANVLEGASRSLYYTVEGRRMALEDEGKPKDEAQTEGTAA